MSFYSIAIDGPSGAGKSTLAKGLAEKIDFLYVDTGAIYRTVGLYVVRQGGDPGQEDAVLPLLPSLRLSLTHGEDGLQRMCMNGEDVTAAIRENAVSGYASRVSALPAVRAFLLEMQRKLAQTQNVVMDGRDIGTVVLPDASVKIFLTASPEVRAKRRFLELAERGQTVPFETVLAEIKARDYADTHRETAPLKKAPDAVLLDTSDLTLPQSLAVLETIVKERIAL